MAVKLFFLPFMLLGVMGIGILGLIVLMLLLGALRHPHVRGALGLFIVIGGMFLLLTVSYSAREETRMEEARIIEAPQPPAPPGRIDTKMESLPKPPSPDEIGNRIAAEKSKTQAEAPNVTVDQQPKPAWVDRAPYTVTEHGVTEYIVTTNVGPYKTEAQCQQNLLTAVQKAAADFAAEQLSSYGIGRVALDDEALRNLIRVTHVETVNTSFGPMFQLYAQLAFDPAAIRAIVVNDRLRKTAIGSGAVLGALGLVYAGLKVTGRKAQRAVA